MSDVTWIFGYGANMNASHLEKQKGVSVFETRPCVLPNFRLRFNLPFLFPKAEPAFANIERSNSIDDEVHGVAFAVSNDDAKKIDKIEAIYERQSVRLCDYTDNWIDGWAYVNLPGARVMNEDGRPTARYLSLLVRGAQEAELQEQYVRRLASVPTHSASPEDVQRRRELLERPLDTFAAITVAELNDMSVSIFGYVFRTKPNTYDAMPKGKEMSKSLLHYYHGMQLLELQDPPFPSVDWLKRNDPDGLEYVMTWLDAFLDSSGECLGRLVEYDSLTTDTYSLPDDAAYPTRVLQSQR